MDPVQQMIDQRCGPAFPVSGWYKVRDTKTVYGCSISFAGFMEVRRDEINQESLSLEIDEAFPMDSDEDFFVGDWAKGMAWYILTKTAGGYHALFTADCEFVD
jgi:hypothetical protein